jgi:predicted Holliday junction resolvase-like endonuclease
VLLATVVIALVLYVRDLRAQLKTAHSEVKDITDQLDRRAKKAVNSSRVVHVAKISEMFAPLLPGFPAYNVKDVQWVGSTIDIIVFDGLEEATQDHFPPGAQVEIIFLDVKTGKSPVSRRQRLIREAVEAGRVRFEVARFQPEDAAAAIARADEEITFTDEELEGHLMEELEVMPITEEELEGVLIIEPDPPGSKPIVLRPLPGPDE